MSSILFVWFALVINLKKLDCSFYEYLLKVWIQGNKTAAVKHYRWIHISNWFAWNIIYVLHWACVFVGNVMMVFCETGSLELVWANIIYLWYLARYWMTGSLFLPLPVWLIKKELFLIGNDLLWYNQLAVFQDPVVEVPLDVMEKMVFSLWNWIFSSFVLCLHPNLSCTVKGNEQKEEK